MEAYTGHNAPKVPDPLFEKVGSESVLLNESMIVVTLAFHFMGTKIPLECLCFPENAEALVHG